MREQNYPILRLIIVIVLLGASLPKHARAQTTPQAAAISGQVITPYSTPAPNVPVRVCPVASVGSPCSTTGVTLYSDPALTHPISNPQSTDQYGNYSFWTTPGSYIVQTTPMDNVTYNYYASPSSGTGAQIIPTPQYHIQMQPQTGIQPIAGPSQVLTDTIGSVNTPATVSSIGAFNNIANRPPSLSGNSSTNFAFDNFPAFTGAQQDVPAIIDNAEVSFFGMNRYSPTGFWMAYTQHSYQDNIYGAGIFNPHTENIYKNSAGDAANYHYWYTNFGTPDATGEGINPYAMTLTENQPCAGNVGSVGTGDQANIEIHMAGTCTTPGVGQFLTYGVNQGAPPTGQFIQSSVTVGAQTHLTTNTTVPVSMAWGTLAADLIPPVVTDPEHPATWFLSTFTVNMLAGTTVPIGTTGVWACSASGQYERFQVTPVSISGTQETFQGRAKNNHFAPSSFPRSGWIMFDTTGLCSTTNAIDFVANRVSPAGQVQYRYPLPILGAIDANTIVGEANFAEYSQPMTLGLVNTTKLTATNITRDSTGLVTMTTNVTNNGGAGFWGGSIYITGTTDSSLVGTCTNSTPVLINTLTCQQTNTTPVTTADAGTVTQGDTGFGNGRYDLVSIAEIVDVRDLTKPATSTDTSVTPAVYHPTQQIDGTFHVAPSPITWSIGAVLFQYTNSLAHGAQQKMTSVINNPVTQWFVGPNETYAPLNSPYFAHEWINSRLPTAYQGYGGTGFAPGGLEILGLHQWALELRYAPAPEGYWGHAGCVSKTGSTFGDCTTTLPYFEFRFDGVGNGHTTRFDPRTSSLMDTVTGTSGFGSTFNRTPTNLQIAEATTLGQQQLNFTGAALNSTAPFSAPRITATTSASAFAAGTTVGGQTICTAGSGCVAFQTNGVANASQTLLNITAGSGITVTNTSGGIVSIAATSAASTIVGGVIVLTAATSDSITLTGIQSGTSRCTFSPDNKISGAVPNDVSQQITATNTYTLNHSAADATMQYDVVCLK